MKTTTKKKVVTEAQLRREIERRNKIFSAATLEEKRVLIAKDVLTQLKTGKLKARKSYFVRFARDYGNGERDFRSAYLKGELPRCEACGVGSLMISCTLFNNSHRICDDALGGFLGSHIKENNRQSIRNGFLDIFEREQLSLIEQAFELGRGELSSDFADEEDWNVKRPEAVAFGKKYRSAHARLVAIMRNIIKNKGTFKP